MSTTKTATREATDETESSGSDEGAYVFDGFNVEFADKVALLQVPPGPAKK